MSQQYQALSNSEMRTRRGIGQGAQASYSSSGAPQSQGGYGNTGSGYGQQPQMQNAYGQHEQQSSQGGYGQQQQGGYGFGYGQQQQYGQTNEASGGYGDSVSYAGAQAPQQSQGGYGNTGGYGSGSGGYGNTGGGGTYSGGTYGAKKNDATSLADSVAKTGFSLPNNLRYPFGLILITACFLHADQNLGAPNLSAIAIDFEMDEVVKDTRLGGYVQAGFFLVGGALSMFIGPLADRLDRSLLLAVVVIAGSVPCLMTLWIPSTAGGFYWYFFARIITGIAIGGSYPVLYSLCGDLFPSSQRSYVAACVGAACNIGAALGGVMAGIVGPKYGWRMPFAAVAIPAIALAVAVKITLKDPRMKHKLEVTKSVDWVNAWAGGRAVDPNAISAGYVSLEDFDMKKFNRVIEVATNKWVLLQAIPGCVPISVIVTFLSDYLSHEMHMDIQASVGVTAMFGISCLFFSLYGGSVGQKLWNSDRERFCDFLCGAMSLAVIPFLLLLNLPASFIASNGSPTFLAYLLSACGGVMAAAGPNIRAILMNVNQAEVRGTVFSTFTLCDDLGKGYGPMFVVLLRSLVGRRMAFSIAFCFWFISAFFIFKLRYTLRQDCKSGGGRFN